MTRGVVEALFESAKLLVGADVQVKFQDLGAVICKVFFKIDNRLVPF